MSTQTRVRSFPNDSYIFDSINQHSDEEFELFEGNDPWEHKHQRMRWVRQCCLEILRHDELSFDLAMHRVLEVSNRSSAEQFQIAPSQASRKGKKAFFMLETGGLGMIFSSGIRQHDAAVFYAGRPPQVLEPKSEAWFISLPEFNATLPLNTGWTDAARFIRKHWKRIQTPIRLRHAGPKSVAIGGWKWLGKTFIHLGIVSTSFEATLAIQRQLNSETVFNCREQCPHEE